MYARNFFLNKLPSSFRSKAALSFKRSFAFRGFLIRLNKMLNRLWYDIWYDIPNNIIFFLLKWKNHPLVQRLSFQRLSYYREWTNAESGPITSKIFLWNFSRLESLVKRMVLMTSSFSWTSFSCPFLFGLPHLISLQPLRYHQLALSQKDLQQCYHFLPQYLSSLQVNVPR